MNGDSPYKCKFLLPKGNFNLVFRAYLFFAVLFCFVLFLNNQPKIILMHILG